MNNDVYCCVQGRGDSYGDFIWNIAVEERLGIEKLNRSCATKQYVYTYYFKGSSSFEYWDTTLRYVS